MKIEVGKRYYYIADSNWANRVEIVTIEAIIGQGSSVVAIVEDCNKSRMRFSADMILGEAPPKKGWFR